MNDYNKMQSFFPAAVILATKERISLGEPMIVQRLWDAKLKTFLAIDFEWYERDHSICLEFGYCALRCGILNMYVDGSSCSSVTAGNKLNVKGKVIGPRLTSITIGRLLPIFVR